MTVLLGMFWVWLFRVQDFGSAFFGLDLGFFPGFEGLGFRVRDGFRTESMV